MQSKVSTKGEEQSLVPEKNHLINRAISDVPAATKKIVAEVIDNMHQNEVELVECECCGMSEDCTPMYIRRIKEFFCGKWVCGLCSEAIKEQMKQRPTMTAHEAVQSQTTFCMLFNRTTRLNPKLSLASSMRDIVRKSCEQRTTKNVSTSRISRTISCGPMLDIDIQKSYLK